MRSLDLSTSSDLRDVSRLLARLSGILEASGVPWFVVGAFARDLLLQYGLGMDVRRATTDLDLAIAVESWELFDEVRSKIGEDSPSATPHRVTVAGTSVDLVPFGGVQEGHRVTWPPDNEITMSVLGFEEVAGDLVSVRLPGKVDISVASIPGQVVLKLLAWKDRRDRKDAVDLKLLVESYNTSDGLDDLFERGERYLHVFEFDNDRTAAALLGNDVHALAGPVVARRLQEILELQSESEQLYLHMPGEPDNSSRLFEAFLVGLNGLAPGSQP